MSTTELVLHIGQKIIVRGCYIRKIDQVLDQFHTAPLDGMHGLRRLIDDNFVVVQEHLRCHLFSQYHCDFFPQLMQEISLVGHGAILVILKVIHTQHII